MKIKNCVQFITMSTTLTISGNESMLQTQYNPPLLLDCGSYECGLLYFSTFNSISNINKTNNVFVYGKDKIIKIPPGTYDLQDIYEYLKKNVISCEIQIKSNNNTFTCSLFCTETVNFEVKNSIGPLLGFSKTKLESNKWHESVNPVNIIPVSVIRIECDLVQGSYTNSSPSHVIHEFALNVPPGHQINEVPKNIIYFPVKRNFISSITVRIVDLSGKLLDFRKENIQLCLHLRKAK